MTEVDNIPEAVADALDVVSDSAAGAAEVTRQASGRGWGLGFGGLVVGLGLGAVGGYFLARRHLEDEIRAEAEEEIAEATAEMREHNQAKVVAAEGEAAKGDLSVIVKEHGYATPVAEDTGPPLGVAPPAAVVEAAEAAREAEVAAAKPAPEVRNVFKDAEVDDVWDWDKEKDGRVEGKPYIVHADERAGTDYEELTLTYYEGDDVLCDERDEVLGPEQREAMVGEDNLDKFGHGSNDASIVYVRNDETEQQFEVVKSPNSYVEEVIGIKHEAVGRSRRRERSSPDDE